MAALESGIEDRHGVMNFSDLPLDLKSPNMSAMVTKDEKIIDLMKKHPTAFTVRQNMPSVFFYTPSSLELFTCHVLDFLSSLSASFYTTTYFMVIW